MKKFYIFIIIIIFAGIKAQSFDDYSYFFDIKTGAQPAYIYMNADDSEYPEHPYIICAGYDANFNNEFDEGDIPPSLWRSQQLGIPTAFMERNIALESELITEFEFGAISYPVYPAVDKENKILYMPHLGKVVAYDSEDGGIINEEVIPDPANSLELGDGRLFCTVPDPAGDDYLLIYNTETELVEDTIFTNKNIIKSKYYEIDGQSNLAVICQGPYNKDSSSVHFIEKIDGKYQIAKSIETIGNAATDIETYIKYTEAYIALALNGSHEVKIFDAENYELINTIDTETTGYNGPNQITFSHYYGVSGPAMLVTFMNGEIKAYDDPAAEPALLNVLESTGKPTDIKLINNDFFIYATNTFVKDSYQPDTTLTVFSGPLSVDYAKQADLNIYPNPVADHATVTLPNANGAFNDYQITIATAEGREISHFSVPAGSENFTFSAAENNLTAGAYFIRINDGNIIYTIPFSVIR